MWRQTDDRKVWYEWIVEVYALHDEPAAAAAAQQGKGKGKGKLKGKEREEAGRRGDQDGPGAKPETKTRKTRIAVSELHSSIKEACLM